MAVYELKGHTAFAGHDLSASNALNRVRSFVKDLFAVSDAQRAYRDTVNELERLSDRDLADIGIARSDIRAIAREAAETKRQSELINR